MKDFYAPATEELPTPQMEFIDVDEDTFHRRVVLLIRASRGQPHVDSMLSSTAT